MSTTFGVSLKMYLGYDQTLRWCRDVAGLCGDHPLLTDRGGKLFVAPSFPAIPAAREIFRGTPIAVGAQNLAQADTGAYTGEVGGPLLREAGAQYVEVGHAERRRMYGEDENVVADKTAAALRNGLVPVLCIGEPEPVEASAAATECVRQLVTALQVSDRKALGGRIVVAYEPIWAIGAAQPAGEAHIRTVCTALREAVAARHAHPDSSVIYGGSAGPGLYGRIAGAADGVFLGRFAHDPQALKAVLDEGMAA
ncbi:triose-phosphate isomerase family protein [Kineosporia sp. NBRC 101731]|uniref:triose-phosphate isomerase family protein n=1 Tax=Kineosporia sp. NBRC 101731 TaxID=3032199 RepID=UPI0024A00F5C|nr:triose-phosphate isomerase family protein [Kineosporia sp. NBRC 101731]GLY29538.1 triosephosphate isomerase [Kineosporia sp. NBRC 101731]